MTGKVTCRDGVRALMDYMEGLLPVPRRRALEQHVSGCRRCQGFVRSYRETPRIMRQATEESLPVRLDRRLRRMIASLPAPGVRRPRR